MTIGRMKPSATHKWLLAAVMAVVWGIAATILWALLTIGFGRSKSDTRLLTMLLLSGVITALLSAYAYTQGWKAGSKAKASPGTSPTPARER